MDALSFHPYPNANTDQISNGYAWPSIGLVNADRLKQAIQDAFGGTSQPTVGSRLKLVYDELGWQVDTSGQAAYAGSENVPVTTEANQAAIYGQIPRLVACDPAISAVNMFGFVDEADLSGFQAGLIRKDGTPRASLNTFREGIAAGCSGGQVAWSPAKGVVGASAKFNDSSPKPAKQTAWNVNATAAEDAHAQLSLFKVKNQAKRCTAGTGAADRDAGPRRRLRGQGGLYAAATAPEEGARIGVLRLRADARGGDERGPAVDVPEQGVPRGPGREGREKAKTKKNKNGKPGKKARRRRARSRRRHAPGPRRVRVPGLCYNPPRVRDTRLDRLGELIAGYSLDLQPGDVVRIEGGDVAEPLLYALYRAALRRGANPYLQVGMDRLSELKVAEGDDEQIAYVSQLEWNELEQLDAVATVWAERNTRSFTNADSERYGRYLSARRELSQRGWERIAAGDLRWCGTLQPVEAYAQDAEMSMEEYEDFVYAACHVTGEDDPVEHWLGVSAELRQHAERLEQVRELRIVGPDTDLTLGVAGRTWQKADGHSNMPDGEVFTSPVESETRGRDPLRLPGGLRGPRGRRRAAPVRRRARGRIRGLARRRLPPLAARDGRRRGRAR